MDEFEKTFIGTFIRVGLVWLIGVGLLLGAVAGIVMLCLNCANVI